MKRITTYLLGLVLVVCGCSVDDSPVPVDPNPGVGGMTFVVNLPDPNAGPSSYALSDEDESKVTSIYVFAFSKNEVSGKYLLVDYSENSGTIETDPLNPRKKTFRVSFTRLKTGDKYKYVVVANGKAAIEATTPLYGEECDDLMEKFTLTGISNWTLAGKDMPMWGESADMTLTTDMKIESLKLLRMVAKINVVVADAMAPKFKMKEILLYNYRSGGYLVPKRENLKAGSTTLVEEPTPLGSRIDFPTAPVTYTEIEDDKSCTNYIYTFETEQPKTAGDAPDFDKMHALVIGAEFDGKAMSYYRVNFNKTDELGGTTFLDLLRNHRYEIKIVEVKGNGYSTPEEAFNSKGLNIGTEILEWDDSEMGEIVYNGQYTLSVSKGDWSFSYAEVNDASGINKVKIRTDTPTGWKVSKITDTSGTPITWLRLNPTTGAADATVECSILLDEWTGTGKREGIIYLTAANLTYELKVAQWDLIPVTDIELVPTYVEVYVDQLYQMQAKILPENATNTTVTWTSANNTVARVGPDGILLGIKEGTTQITASIDGKSATANVKVLGGFYPDQHIGWAGCNIYYDNAKKHLTFDDVGVLKNQSYQGVFFAPNSLYALQPSPQYNPDYFASGYNQHGLPILNLFINIPQLTTDENRPDDPLRALAFELYDPLAGLGDICRHLTLLGYAPKGSWRLPTAAELQNEDWKPIRNTAYPQSPSTYPEDGTSKIYDGYGMISKNVYLPANSCYNDGSYVLYGGYQHSSLLTTKQGAMYCLRFLGSMSILSHVMGNSAQPVRCVKMSE